MLVACITEEGKWEPTNVYIHRADSVVWEMTQARRHLDSWSLRDDEGLTSGICGVGGRGRRRRMEIRALSHPVTTGCENKAVIPSEMTPGRL